MSIPKHPVRDVHRTTTATPILEIIEWLSGNECHELDDAGLIAGLGRRLTAAGLPLDRLSLHLRTLHPAGVNPFNVYRAEDRPQPARFPVFIHSESDHGPISAPIHS